MNEILKLLNKFLVLFVPNTTVFPFDIFESIKILVIKIAVNSEVAIPIKRVVAKPFMGPVPKINKINAVNPVVIFASKMDDNALLNPSETALI